jgi:hypothetical protein
VDEKGGALFSLLVSRFAIEGKDKLVKKIPEEDQKWISKAEFMLQPMRIPVSILTVEGWLHKIHYSWFEQPLKELPLALQSVFLGILPQGIAQFLSKQLHLAIPPKPPSKIGKAYLFSLLKKKVLPSDLVAEELLEPSPMLPLFNLSKKELIHVINLLGMYDVAVEVKRIIDRSLLHKILAPLSHEQRDFLKICLQKPIKWTPPSLGIETAWQDEKKWQMQIHQRGLWRLAFACAFESKSFIWHLTHFLDISRGNILLEAVAKIPKKEWVSYFQEQVLETLKNR